MSHDVTVQESTNQVIITDPSGGTAKVVSVGVRGPAGRDAVDEVNRVQDNVYALTANVDTVSSNVDLVQSNLSSLTSDSLTDIDLTGVTDGDLLVYVAANARFEVGQIVDDEELDLSSIHDNVVALTANVDVVSSNVESAEIRAAANTAVVQANLDAYAATANALIAGGSAGQVQDNVTALAANVDIVSSNVDALETRVVANLNILEANAQSLETRVSANVDLVQSNLDALVGHGNVTVGVGSLQNEITVLSSDAKHLYLSANVTSPDANIIFSSNLIPDGNAVYSIGAPDAQIRDIYVSDGTIFIGVNTSITSETITLGNFNVDADGSIRIPGVDIAADANAVESVQIVASDLASNAAIHAITGETEDLVTANTVHLVAAINEIFNKTNFSALSVNTSISAESLEISTNASVGGISIAGSNISATEGTLTFDGTDILVQGNLIVEGNTTQVDSTVTTLQDPIVTLGGNSALTVDDGKDRGVEFRYYEDSQSKLGFFGYDNDANAFTFFVDAVNSEEEFSGTHGDVRFGDVTLDDLSANVVDANYVVAYDWFEGNVRGNVEATTVNVSDSITTVSIDVETLSANSLSANTIVGGVEGDVTGNITGNIVSQTANVTALEIVTVNSLTFPTEDGTSNQVLATDGAGNLFFKNDNSGGGSGVGIVLGVPSDGTFTDGAYQSFESGDSLTDAIDTLNEVIENVRNDTFVKSVSFTASPTSGNSPLSVALSISATGNANQYEIDWGDGTSNTTTSSSTPSHTYTVPEGGTQTITVTAKNTSGSGEGSEASNTRADYISLATPAPIAGFTLADDTLDSSSSVSLTNISQYTDSYEIDWGDGSANTSLGSSGAGTPGGGAITHAYTNTGGDATYTITLTAASSSNGQDDSTTDEVYVYSTHSPTFSSNVTSGNNEEATSGLPVRFTNTTSTSPGANSSYPDTIQYVWTWGDGTTNSVSSGSGSAGDTSQTIDHTFALSDREVQQTFEVQLQLYNGHSSSPFASANTTITVNPDPRAEFTGTFVNQSTGLTSSSVRTGYLFTDYLGNKRNVVTFLNQSENTADYEWDFGDSNTVILAEGADGTPTGGNIVHEYATVGNFTVELTANGTYSLSATDDTDTLSNYITIASNPTPPAGLSSKTITMSGEDVGTDPKLAANFDDNTGGASATAGDDLPRTVDQVGFITTDVLSTFAGTSNTGTLSATVNGSVDGSKAFTTGDDSGTYTSLVISSDIDANTVDSGGNTVSGGSKIYPTGFYRVFKAYIQKSATALSDGVNSFRLSHSESGNTNTLEFIKESLTTTPTIDLSSATLSQNAAGTQRYISGIPYYNTGGSVTLSGAQVYNWIDQTYRDTTTPFQIEAGTNDESTSGNVINSQTRSYTSIDGSSTFLSGGIPIKGTGINSGAAYSLGNININIDGTARAIETLKFRMLNVNGSGSYSEFTGTKIQAYSDSISGFNEELITVSDDLGATYDDDGKRIVISGASGATPGFNSATNYYTGAAWSGSQTIAGTDESVVRWGTLSHFTTDLSTGYLPVGPDLNTGRSGTQYFRMAFRRSNMSNFVVRISGQISSFNIALPGSGIDDSSGSNGWLDATVQYAGAGQPGSNTGNGGNGSDGCALTGGDIIPTGTSISNQTYTLTFGTENASNSTGNQVLISIGLASGDSITALSFEETS